MHHLFFNKLFLFKVVTLVSVIVIAVDADVNANVF